MTQAQQSDALTISTHLRSRAKIASKPGNIDTLSAAAANALERLHARVQELEAKEVNIEEFRVSVTEAARTPLLNRIAELEQSKCLHQIAEPAQVVQLAVPSDWKIVPLRLTQAMADAAKCVDGRLSVWKYDDAYKAMLANAPQPPITQPAAQGLDAQNLYYLQDARHHSMVGNCPSFWRPDGNGYTTNLDEAERFTFEEAMKQHKRRETDLPWLCAEVDKLRRPTVDCQYMPRSWDAQRAALAAQAKQGGA